MNLPARLVGDGWIVAGWIVLALLAWRDLRHAPWASLRDDGRLDVWLGAIVALALLWSMKAGVSPGLDLHFIGATVLVLVFGRPLAFVALLVVLFAVTVNRGGEWSSFGLNAVMIAALPALIAQGIAGLVRRLLPAQVFVFIFANGFFGAAITVFLSGLGGCLLLALAGAYPAAFLAEEYLPYFMLLGFAEAWLSGMVLTLMIVYRPRWVSSFDDRKYLGSR